MTEDFKSFSYGLSSSVIKIIVTSIISLIIAPIILNNVDDKTYGAILMITEFTAWFTLVQLGTSTVLSSRLPKFILDGDELKVNKYQGTAFLTQILFGILVLVLFSLVLFWFDEIFPELSNIPGIYLIFIVSATSVFLIVSFQSLTASLIAFKKIHVDNIIGIGTALLRIPLLMFLFYLELDALSIVLVDVIVVVITLIITYLRLNSLTRVSSFRLSKTAFCDLVNNGFLATIGTVGGMLIHNTDRFVLGNYLGPEYVLPFVFMSKIYFVGLRFHGSVFSTIRPYLSAWYNDNLIDNISKKKHTINFIHLSVNLAFIICASGMLFNKMFLQNWVGLNYFVSDRTNSLLAVLFLLQSTALPFRILFVCTVYEMKKQNVLRLFEGVANILLSVLLVKFYGFEGILWASILTVSLFSLLGYSYLLIQGFTGEMKSVLQIIMYCFFLVVIFLSVGHYVNWISKGFLIVLICFAGLRMVHNARILKDLL